MSAQRSFASPEEAALSAWAGTPAAAARVVAVRPAADDDAVWVVLQLGNEPSGFHDQDIVTCLRQDDGTWVEGGSTGASSV
jgi:hypothetical protein